MLNVLRLDNEIFNQQSLSFGTLINNMQYILYKIPFKYFNKFFLFHHLHKL